MYRKRTLLFVGAHPDDETFGIGGTLAKYSREGARVYYACATRGEAGSVSAEQSKEFSELGDLRWAELECAAQILGLAGIFYLGYRDSGMTGSDENKKPGALASIPIQEVTGSIVRVIRKVQPQVVITFDPIGGYRHPDHIVVHNATVKAFYAAGNPNQYPDDGPIFHPQKLYFSVFPRGILKLLVKIMPLLGHDPHKFGRNKDIDLASILEVEYPAHARVSLSKQDINFRMKAVSCHASQLEDNSPRRNLLDIARKLFREKDGFMRSYPPVEGLLRETDLFEGIE